jgi:phosphoheptose isomerase
MRSLISTSSICMPHANDGYLSGVRELSDGLQQLAQDIRAVVQNYSKVIFVGNSIEADAALHFGHYAADTRS